MNKMSAREKLFMDLWLESVEAHKECHDALRAALAAWSPYDAIETRVFNEAKRVLEEQDE